MDDKKKLIIFAEDWGRFPSSSQHLINALLKQGWDVIWINSIGLRKPQWNGSYIKRALGKIYHSLSGVFKKNKSSLPKNLTVIHPFILPFIGYSLINRFNKWMLGRQLRTITQKRGFVRPIIWATLPTAYPYLSLFPNSAVVYYCCDDYELIIDKPYPQLPIYERQLIDKASLVIVSSEVLAAKAPASKTYFLDHGIDLSLYLKRYPRPKDLPQGRPIAGFYGSITHWVDLDLLYQCALELPNWNFVLIGPKEVDISRLESLNNFFYLGPKPYPAIPAYSEHWDVGLIPFIKNKLVLACNPLKVKEYLAGGKPIVSVEIPALAVYKECIYLAKDKADFIKGIQLSLEDKNASVRLNLAKKESWDSKVEQLNQQLLAIL